jgi:shikimate dehydrogenase
VHSEPTYELLSLRYAYREGVRGQHFLGHDTASDDSHPTAYYVWLARSDAHTVLIDAGMTAGTASGLAGLEYIDSPLTLLRDLGVEPGDIDVVVLTHLHYDHTGLVDQLPTARFVVQQSEWDYWHGPWADRITRETWLRSDHDLEVLADARREGRVSLVDGETEVLPGLTVHLVGGHTAGMQVVSVRTTEGTAVVASDASHFYENLELDRPAPLLHDMTQVYGAYDAITALAEPSTLFLPGHDPDVMTRHPRRHPGNENVAVVAERAPATTAVRTAEGAGASTRDGGEPHAFVVGLIGAGIGPSLTPALHEQEARHFGLDYTYRIIDLPTLGLEASDVGELVRNANRLGFDALNITHPCKQLVLEHLDEVDDIVGRVGAANTVLFRKGRAIGHNTDVTGFTTAVREGLPGAPMGRVVQIGAGGAGAAIAHALTGLGVESLTIVDTSPERSAELAAVLGRTAAHVDVTPGGPELLADALRRADGMVHCTPTGMLDHPGLPLDAELLREDLWVADIVYRPVETALLTQARRIGCRVLDGGAMAVHQAVDAFALITGLTPDAERMAAHFRRLVER